LLARGERRMEPKLIETREGQKVQHLKWKCYDLREARAEIRGRIVEQQRHTLLAHSRYQQEIDHLGQLKSRYEEIDAKMAEIDGRLTTCRPKLEPKTFMRKKKKLTPAQVVAQIKGLNFSREKLAELVAEMEV
jgi:chromosome segregation ATPase